MSIKGLSTITLGIAAAGISILPITQAPALENLTTLNLANTAGQPAPLSKSQSITSFQSLNPNSGLTYRADGSIGRVYGKAFSQGRTGAQSAQRFLDQNLAMWGVPANQLVAEGPFDDARHTQQIGYLPEFDDYKFTGHYYKQIVNGLPVFRSKLVLLTRNEANNPLVLASSELRDLGNFTPDPQLQRQAINHNRIVENAKKHYNLDIILDSTERLIYAGTESFPHQPTLADSSIVIVNGFEKQLVISDAATGKILFTETLIHTLDITGNTSAIASEGPGADFCEDEVPRPLPYLFVNGPAGTALTDIDGNYTLTNPGVTPVTVDATLTGQWFQVFDFVGSVESQSILTTPPGPADFIFNAANATQSNRAQVNAYIEANIARDYTLAANPAYPGTNFQMDVIVNRNDGFCPGNAWYDPSEQSINFCSSGGSNPNTAWSSVVHHEYGHHLVNTGGSGQGQYGEGMGDVLSVIILDDPRLGVGFFGSCGSSLRSAEAGQQYPCSAAIHTCGQILSGSVWETRNAMVANGISNYTEILNFLAINAILVHSGDLITPQITIDYLTLDDDDADIGNGTPHYAEIATGFGLHNMDAPPLNVLAITYPMGLPDLIDPSGGTTMLVDFAPISSSVDPASTMLMVDSGSGFVGFPMTQNSATEFEATFPATNCGSEISFYVTSESNSGAVQNSPTGAPNDAVFSAISSFGPAVVAFEDDFQTNQGWTVDGNIANAATGRWERAVPTGGGVRGDPANDFDGSGMCFVTGNGGPNSNTDVDDGVTNLVSPVLDASGDATVVTYSRWYDNSFGNAPMADVFVVEVSDNAGANWTNLETVGPGGSEVSGGWVTKQFSLNDVPGFVPNNQFQIRFRASDLGDGSVVEAGVDGFMLSKFDCVDDACPADFSGEGDLNFLDVSAFLTAFGNQDPAADFTGEGDFNFLDVSAFLAAFAAGCP